LAKRLGAGRNFYSRNNLSPDQTVLQGASVNPYSGQGNGIGFHGAQMQAQQGVQGHAANPSGYAGTPTGAVNSQASQAYGARYTQQARNALGIGREGTIAGLNRVQNAEAQRYYRQFFASPAGFRPGGNGERWNMLTYRSLFGNTGRTVPYGAGFTAPPTDPLGLLAPPGGGGGGGYGGGGGGPELYNPNLGLTNWRI
jgi:hypothetical protein